MQASRQLAIDGRQLINWLETPACLIQLPDTLIEANTAFVELIKTATQPLAGTSLLALLPDVDAAELNSRLTQTTSPAPLAVCLRSTAGHGAMLLRTLTTADPALRLLSFTPIVNDTGQPLANTHHAAVEYQALMANAPVGIGYSKNRRLVRYNDTFAQMFGFQDDNGIGQPTTTLYPSEEAHRAVSERAYPLLINGQPYREIMLMRRQDDRVFWGDVVAYLIDPNDPPQGSIWIINDISDRKAAEKALHSNLLETQAIIDNASVGLVFTRDRKIQRCNRRMEEIFGYEPDELTGQPAIILYPSRESYDRIGREAGPLLSAGQAFLAEWEYRNKDGSLLWARTYAKAINPDDTSSGTVWIVEDITASKAVQDTLAKSLREMEALIKNASVGILITKERRILRSNPRFAEMFGFANADEIGQLARILYRSDEEYAELGQQAASQLSKAQPFQTELFMRRQDGSDMWANLIGYVADPADTSRGTFWLIEDRSAYKQAELALQQAYAEQKLIFDHSVVGISFVKNRTIQRCNHRFEELYGYAPGELIGRPTRVTYYSEQGYAAVGEAAYKALGRGETFVSETIHQRQDGEPFWIRITGKAINPAAPNDGSIWNFEDITARKVAEDALRQSEMLQRAILDSARLMILSTDPKGNIVSCNPATEQMLGRKCAELLGHPPTECFFLAEELLERRQSITSELEIHPETDIETLFAKVRLGSVEQSEWTFRRANGEHFPVELSISSLHQGQCDENGFLLVANDITERKLAAAALLRSHDELENRVKERTIELEGEVNERRRAESRLRYLALHDPLTGLPNRNFLQQRIRETLEQAHNTEHRVAILFIDLDRFKTINDSLGHHIGDALLKQVAHRLTEALRTDDTVARIGGDEFVIIVPITDGEEKSANIAEKILDTLQPSFRIDGHELFVTPSIGICLYPHDGNSVEALMRNADTAMYQAKAAGRNTYRFFHPSMNAAVDNYFKIESSLRRAIDRQEFEVYYQPIINAKNGKPAAFEALVRWQHPTHGLLAPGRFITVAEESGLIDVIGGIVLRAVCSQIRNWLDAGFQPPQIAVNLSPIQFRDPNLISGIIAIVDEFGLTPDRIELEITETTLMQDGELTLSTLDSLSKYGFKLSVDDFGTGYSSLAYLKRFPVDTLKIDRSFIIDMTTDEDDRAIVTAILALARSLRLSVVAEGVETEAQFNALAALGCGYIQGYLISRPATAADMALYLGTPPEITKTGTL